MDPLAWKAIYLNAPCVPHLPKAPMSPIAKKVAGSFLLRTRPVLLTLGMAFVLGCKNDPTPSISSSESDAMNTAKVTIHPLVVKRLDGSETPLSAWSGKVLLIVNTASECGYTPQYQGLQALHAKYEARGFAVLGFPSNDFGGQEPGTSEEIRKFCTSKFGVSFPMFDKVRTVGTERAPLYARLSDALGTPKWNFHKYLIDKAGRPLAAWPSSVKPDSSEIESAIKLALSAPDSKG